MQCLVLSVSALIDRCSGSYELVLMLYGLAWALVLSALFERCDDYIPGSRCVCTCAKVCLHAREVKCCCPAGWHGLVFHLHYSRGVHGCQMEAIDKVAMPELIQLLLRACPDSSESV